MTSRRGSYGERGIGPRALRRRRRPFSLKLSKAELRRKDAAKRHENTIEWHKERIKSLRNSVSNYREVSSRTYRKAEKELATKIREHRAAIRKIRADRAS